MHLFSCLKKRNILLHLGAGEYIKIKVQTRVFVSARSEPVFFGIFKVLLVVSGLEKVALDDTNDSASRPLA